MLNFPLVCRFCLVPSEINQTIGIFDGTNELPEKILELTDIEVVNEDGLPQEVCFVCREQLDLSVTFKKQIIKADCMLREYLSQQVSPTSFPGPLITGDILLAEQKVPNPSDESQEEKQEVADSVNENQGNDEANALSSVEEMIEEDKLTSDCSEYSGLNKEFNSNSEFVFGDSFADVVKEEIDDDYAVAILWPESFQSENLDENTSLGIEESFDEIEENELKEDNQNECKVDQPETTQVKQEKKETEEPFSDASVIEDSDKTQVKVHLNYFDRIYCSCKFCLENKEEIKLESENSGDEELVNWSESQRLRRSSRPSKVPERHVVPHYSCSKCERMYNDQATLENHEKTHLIIFKCNHCGRKFSNKDHLTKHIQTSHIGKSLKNQCQICGKSYEKRPHLFSHMRSHKSTVHLCDICGKTVSLSAYPAHKRSHMNTTETFQCDLCQKQFNSKMSLRNHKSSYHGSLKFTCEVCGKQFTTMALMKHHQNTHSGRRDHVCTLCGRAFSLKVTLRTHMRTHTGEMPYTCETCGRSFTWKTTYKNHVASCKTNQALLDSKSTNNLEYYNMLQMPQNVTQETPIDYSEDAKYKVPTDYGNEVNYRHLRSESRFSSSAIKLSEGMKYSYQ